MVRRPSRSRRVAVLTALASLFLTVAPAVSQAHADSVDDQRRKVQQIADELDRIAARATQLDDDYTAALDRQDQLAGEIADLQVKVDAQQAELDALQGTLAGIAIDKYVKGGSLELSPLFSNAAAYNDAQQRDQLRGLALDQGAGESDDLQSLVDGLAKQRASLDRKTKEAADLIGYLDTKRSEAEQLETQYQQAYDAAQAELGDLLEQEQERRAAEAAAAAQRAAQNAARNRPVTTPTPARGGGNTGGGNTGGGNTGGGNTGGGNTGGGNTGGGNTGGGTPAPAPAPPPVSGKASVAINAAYGQLGVPYRYAAEEPGVAFDCSGLTKYAWGRAGVYLPHQSRQQFAALPHVSKDQAQPGDLIFYYSPISHVGIYLGNGQLIHSPRTGDSVKIANVSWGKVVGVARPG
jgi:cell wall-associated NlpC family hydrolase